jgi:hypothetical protein
LGGGGGGGRRCHLVRSSQLFRAASVALHAAACLYLLLHTLPPAWVHTLLHLLLLPSSIVVPAVTAAGVFLRCRLCLPPAAGGGGSIRGCCCTPTLALALRCRLRLIGRRGRPGAPECTCSRFSGHSTTTEECPRDGGRSGRGLLGGSALCCCCCCGFLCLGRRRIGRLRKLSGFLPRLLRPHCPDCPCYGLGVDMRVCLRRRLVVRVL